jgi:tetratricopeptide (TPR) repeat protein
MKKAALFETTVNYPRRRAARFAALSILLIVVATAGLYYRTLEAPIQISEREIFEDPTVTEGRGLLDVEFWTPVFSHEPLATATLAANYAFGGEETVGYRVVNLLIHLVSAVAVFLIVRITYRTPAMRDSPKSVFALRTGLFAALLFATHPLQTSATASVAHRGETLSAMFYLLGVAAYARARLERFEQGGHKFGTPFYVAAGVSYLFAVLANASTVFFPAVVYLYELFFFRTKEGRMAWRSVAALTLAMLGGALVFAYAVYPRLTAVEFPSAYHFTQLKSFGVYMRLAAAPIDLHPLRQLDPASSMSEFGPLVGVGLMVGLAGLAGAVYRRYRMVAFAALMIPLAFAFYAVVPTGEAIAERRFYLSMFGVGGATAAIMYALAAAGRLKPAVSTTILALLVVASVYGSAKRIESWRDLTRVWMENIEQTPRQPQPYLYAGASAYERGEYRRAKALLLDAVTRDPDYAEALNYLGKTYRALGDADSALFYFDEAISADPSFGEPFRWRGEMALKAGRHDDAVSDFEAATALDPKDKTAHYLHGRALLETRDFGDAIDAFTRATEIDESYAEPYAYRALAYDRLGRERDAADDVRRAKALAPGKPEPFLASGALFMRRKMYREAVVEFDKAIARKPAHTDALYRRAMARYAVGERELAKNDIERCLALDPKHRKAAAAARDLFSELDDE